MTESGRAPAGPAQSLHVLAYGELDSGVTDSLRLGIFRAPLASLGVEVRSWQSFADDALMGGGARLTAIEWADVLLFRRWRPTHTVCTECESTFAALGALERHVRQSGHRTMVPDLLLRPIVDLLEAHPELISSKAVVYDTDDDVVDYPDWTGFARAAARERDLVLRILGLADLVTVATPVLAARFAPHARGRVRVIRNALDPRWYEATAATPAAAAERAAGSGVRVVYHGVPVRLRDYEIARGAVDAAVAELPGRRRIWLGAAEEPRVLAAVDEVHPWVDGLPEFARALVEARPDIGLAPLRDEPFNRAKSELHWLEYSLAGAATVVSGFRDGGPYDAVRDGVDGLVAREPGDWLTHLRALAGSSDLRAEIAGRARERVAAEYSIDARAPELADAYRWAAANPGFGRRRGVGVQPGSERPSPEPAPVRVLVVGPGAASASDALRFVAMAPRLAPLGVEMACWAATEVPDPAAEFELFEDALSMADVVVLRRSYRTYHSCLACGLRTLDRAEIRAHARSARHDTVESPFALLRPLVDLLETEPGVLGGRPIVYDTDDDIFSAELPPGAEDLLERDLVERMLALADLVTVSTPVLAERLSERLAGRTKSPVRVIRNALDPAWYVPSGEVARPGAGPDGPGPEVPRPGVDVRVVHHGNAARLAEYEVARAAVDAVTGDTPAVRRVWVGSIDARVRAVVDETRPWVQGLPEFGRALAESRPDIGLAPLRDTPYNRCRSELHWLEYSLAGAATIASGFAGPGPYDPIRNGVDGLIARDRGEWGKHLRALTGSVELRRELAGSARERVIAGYSPIARAAEWADAYRCAMDQRRPRR